MPQRRQTRRRRFRGGEENRKVDLVIARYKESLSWLPEYKERGFHTIHIYNKSDKEINCPDIENKDTKCHIKSIPNVGVCDQTYLYHIVNHYKELADVTIFAPGSAEIPNKKPILDFTIGKAFETKNTVMNTFEFDVSVKEAMYEFTMPTYPTGYPENKNGEIGESPQTLADVRPFGAWWEANFPGVDVKKATFFGIMAISKEHIHQHPVEFYKKLLDQISRDKFHEASHFMERAYTGMCHPIPDNCLYTSHIFDNLIGKNQNDYKALRRQKGGRTRKNRKRRHRGGRLKFVDEIDTKAQSGGADRNLVFYTCFFGKDDNVANKIPPVPSEKYKCYFFSNNNTTLAKLEGTKWHGVFIDIPIKNTNRNNAMDAKELKACPHLYKELKEYEFSCYLDSKLNVKDTDVEDMITKYLDGKDVLFVVNRHPGIGPRVMNEFNEAMKQPRYRENKDKYESYIKKQINSGLRDTVRDHYETSFILRKSGEKTNEINEKWYEHIKETGIECQISFFFIQQIFNGLIVPLETTYGR